MVLTRSLGVEVIVVVKRQVFSAGGFDRGNVGGTVEVVTIKRL